MAQNDVIMRFKIMDDGSLKAVGQDAEKVGKKLDKAGKGAHNVDRQLKGAAQASSGASKNFSKMSQGISGGLVPAYATLAATMFAVTAVFRGLEQAFNWKAQAQGLAMFAEQSGIAMQTLVADMRAATGGLLNFKEAAQAAQIGIASGLSPKDLKDLAEGAKLVSGALGRDLEDSFNRLVRGVTKAEPELLDELGIVLRLDIATRKYAGAHGLLQNQLTLSQRMQAVNAEVQGQLNEKFGEFKDTADALMNPFTKLQTAFTDLTKSMSEYMLPPLVAIAQFLSENTEAAALLMAGFAASIMRSAFPALGTLSASMIKFGAESKKAAATARREFKKSGKAYKMAKQDWNASDVVHKNKFKAILTKMGIDHKVWLKKKVVDQERSIAMMLANEHKKGAKVRLLAAGELAYLRTIHGQIAASHANMTAKMIAGANAAATGMTSAMAASAAASTGILVGLGTLAQKLAPTFAFLGSAMGWLFGIATTVFIGKFIWDWVAGTGVFDAEANKLDDTWASVLGKLQEIDTIMGSQVNNIDNALRGTMEYNNALVKQANIWANLDNIKLLETALGDNIGEGSYEAAQADIQNFFAQYLGAGIQTDHSGVQKILEDMLAGARAQQTGYGDTPISGDAGYGGAMSDTDWIQAVMGADFAEGGDAAQFETFLKRVLPLLSKNKELTKSLGNSLVEFGDSAEVEAGESIKKLRAELEALENIQTRMAEKYKGTEAQRYYQAIMGTIKEGRATLDKNQSWDFIGEVEKAGIKPGSIGLKEGMKAEGALKQLGATERVLKLSYKLTATLKARVGHNKSLVAYAGRLSDSHSKSAANQFKITGLTMQSETLMASILEKKSRLAGLDENARLVAAQEMADDVIKLENLGMQIELLKEQENIMTQIRDKGIEAFDKAGESGIKDMLTNKEGSAGDMLLGVAQSTLGGMAGAASKKIMSPITGGFKKLMGIEDPEDKQKRVFDDHVSGMETALKDHIKGIKGTDGTAGSDADIDSILNDVVDGDGKVKIPGMKDIFSKIFGGGGFGDIFSIFSGMFGFGAKGGFVRKYNSGTGPEGAKFVPGSGNRDTVPAMLTPGEIVVPKGKRVGGNYNTTINVNMEGGVDVTTDDESGRALGLAIQSAVSEEIAHQQMPGGLLSPFGGGTG